MIFKNAFSNKKVIITGHTGFKGAWLTAWLKQLGANVANIPHDAREVERLVVSDINYIWE